MLFHPEAKLEDLSWAQAWAALKLMNDPQVADQRKQGTLTLWDLRIFTSHTQRSCKATSELLGFSMQMVPPAATHMHINNVLLKAKPCSMCATATIRKALASIPVRDISLLARRTLTTCSSPSGVSSVREPVARFTTLKLLQQTAKKATSCPNLARKTKLMASLGAAERQSGQRNPVYGNS